MKKQTMDDGTTKEYFLGKAKALMLSDTKTGKKRVSVPIDCEDGETRWWNHVLMTDEWCVRKVLASLNRLYDFGFTEGSPQEIEAAMASGSCQSGRDIQLVIHDVGKDFPNVYVNELKPGSDNPF